MKLILGLTLILSLTGCNLVGTDNESALRQYGELKVEIRVIGTKLDSISDRLKGVEESANANAHAANAAAVAATAAANAAALAVKATK